MSTIVEKVNRLSNYKSDIKNAIIEKGQSVADDMSAFPDAIRAIQTGGGGEDDLGQLLRDKLTEYRLPSDLPVGDWQWPFMSARGIEKVDLNGATTIPSNAFDGCSGLKEIVGLENVMTIQGYSLRQTAIEYANLPNCTFFGENWAWWCTKLKEIYTPHCVGVAGGCYSCSRLEYALLGGSTLQNNVVGRDSFRNCSSLKYIDYYAVSQVPQLADKYAFGGGLSTQKIIVPDELYDEWIVATNWTAVAGRIVKNSDVADDPVLQAYRSKYV